MGYPTQQQKVDYLFKKLGFTKAKTGVAEDQTSGFSGDTKKAPPNEAISSPLIVPATSVWADTSYIPATPPNSSDGYVGVYKTTSAFQMTVDTTVSNNRSFIARDTWGNPASAIKGDWIDTQFGADYLIKVYKGDPSTGAATKILSAAGTSGKDDVWFFDYSSGILNFNGEDIDGQLSGITTSNIYIVGYRYLGTKGIQPPAGIGTFNNLYVSGVSTFVGNAYANSDVQVGGTLSVTGISTFNGNVYIPDSVSGSPALRIGSDEDFKIYHNGSHAYLENDTGQIVFKTPDNNNKVIIENDGLGIDEKLYHLSDKNTHLKFPADDTITLTTAGTERFRIRSDGNINIANALNVTGIATFAADIDANADVDIAANLAVSGVSTFTGAIDANGDLDVDGRSELDNVNIAETLNVVGISTFNDDVNLQGANAGVTSAYWDKSANEFKFIDNAKLSFGTDQDLELYHSSGNSYVKNTTAGSLLIQGDTIDLRPGSGDTGEVMLRAVRNAQVELRHDNSARFTTTGYGVSVYGGQAGIGTLGAPAIFHIDPGTVGDDTGTVVIKGNLQVDGTQTTVNSSTMDVADKNVGIASGAANDAAADGAGITVYSGDGNKTLNWVDSTDAWTSSEHFDLAAGKSYDIAGTEIIHSARATLGGTLSVAGVSTFNNNVFVGGGNVTVDGNIDLNGDIDVDGTSDLDQVNIAQGLNVTAGIATFAADIDANADMELAGNLAVTGVSTFTGISTFSDNVGFATDITWGGANYTSSTPLTFDQKHQIGVTTFLFQSGGSNQPEFTFRNDYNGNWGTNFNSGTQYHKFIWEAPNEAGISTVDNGYLINRKIAAVQEIATHTGGGDPKIQFRVNDGTSTLVRVWTAEHDSQVWRVNDVNYVGLNTTGFTIQNNVDFFANGHVTLGSNTSDNLTINARVASDINPDVTDTYKLGSTKRWLTVYSKQLNITGVSTFAGDIDANADMELAGNLAVTGVSTFTGISTFSSTVVSQKSVQIEENLNVTGITTFNGAITLPPGTGGNFGNINIAVTGNNEIDTDSGTGNLILDSAGGTINVDDGLTVAGVSTFSSGVNFEGIIIGSPGIDLQLGGNINSNSGITTLGVTTATNLTLQQLNVSGVSTFSGDVEVADYIKHKGDTNTAIRFPDDDTITFTTANTEKLRIKSGGNVGIGSDDPAQRLVLYHDTSVLLNLEVGSTTGTSGIYFSDKPANSGRGRILYFHHDDSMMFRVNGAEKVRLKSSGNLGIGVSDPQAKLDVNGTLNVSGAATFNVDTDFIGGGAGITSAYWDQSAASFKFLDNVKAQFGDSQDLSIWHNGANSFIEDSGTGALYIDTNHLYFRKYNTGDVLAMFQSDASVQLFHSGTKRLETTGTGVDITDNLNVAGVSTFVGETNIGTGGTVFTALVGAAASVGIGSATPDYMLDVAGAINSETDVKVQGVSISDTALNDAVAMAIALG